MQDDLLGYEVGFVSLSLTWFKWWKTVLSQGRWWKSHKWKRETSFILKVINKVPAVITPTELWRWICTLSTDRRTCHMSTCQLVSTRRLWVTLQTLMAFCHSFVLWLRQSKGHFLTFELLLRLSVIIFMPSSSFIKTEFSPLMRVWLRDHLKLNPIFSPKV